MRTIKQKRIAMTRQKPTGINDVEQYRRDCVALRQKLGIVGNRFTPEQKEAYLEAQRVLLLKLHPGAISGGPPRRKIKSEPQS
jgi:hypothetical protein